MSNENVENMEMVDVLDDPKLIRIDETTNKMKDLRKNYAYLFGQIHVSLSTCRTEASYYVFHQFGPWCSFIENAYTRIHEFMKTMGEYSIQLSQISFQQDDHVPDPDTAYDKDREMYVYAKCDINLNGASFWKFYKDILHTKKQITEEIEAYRHLIDQKIEFDFIHELFTDTKHVYDVMEYDLMNYAKAKNRVNDLQVFQNQTTNLMKEKIVTDPALTELGFDFRQLLMGLVKPSTFTPSEE